MHLLILLLFLLEHKEILFPHTKERESKLTLNIQQIVTPAPQPIQTPTEQEVLQTQKQKLTEDPLAQHINAETNTTKPTPKRVVKQIPKNPTHHTQDPLANMLMQSPTAPYRPKTSPSDPQARMIRQLYGKAFERFTPAQQTYIETNLNLIQQITQYTLTQHGYPEVAIQTRQQGTNIVSFLLHPNGDISGLRLKTRIGYQALDDNTLEVIQIAYKSYPLPNQTTQIIFYVKYMIE